MRSGLGGEGRVTAMDGIESFAWNDPGKELKDT